MAQKAQNSTPKERLIFTFILVCSVMIPANIGNNIINELRIASEHKILTKEEVPPQVEKSPTLSEKEMKRWTNRLKKEINK